VRLVSGSLRVNARLVDTRSGQQLWSGSLDRNAADLFAVQDEIAQSVADALHLVLNPQDSQRLVDPQTDSLSAYDAYLQGRSALALRTAASTRRAVDHFREATRLDPDFGLAWGGLVEAHYLSASYGFAQHTWPEVSREARAAAGKAQSLDPDSGEAWLAQAFAAIGDNQFGGGTAWPKEHIVALLRKAVELSPNNAVALKVFASLLDVPEEGLAMLERAAVLDPRSAIIRQNIGDMYRDLGNLEKALHYYREALRVVPSFALAYLGIIGVHDVRGEFDQVARLARAFFREHPDDILTHFAYSDALMKLGAWDEFERYRAGYSSMSETAYAEWGWLMKWRAELIYGLTRNDCGTVIEDIRKYWDPVPAEGQPWQDVTRVSWGEAVLNARALCEWIEGRPESALHMLQSGIPNLEGARTNDLRALEFGTEVLFAALLKANGRSGEVRQVLTRFLDQTRDLPAAGGGGIGFGRFFALAVLGDTDAALDALDFALDSGHTNNLWALDLLDSDPDFAKTIADPRFAEIMARLEERIRPLRESYLANPELPEGSYFQ
jgi:tetratricopeptide (TPR) repeat protein